MYLLNGTLGNNTDWLIYFRNERKVKKEKEKRQSLADLGGGRPPKGPNSFVLTYKFYET